MKRTTGPKDQQCTDLSPLSLWTGGDTRPTETRTAARIFNIQFSIFNRNGTKTSKRTPSFRLVEPPSGLGLCMGETDYPCRDSRSRGNRDKDGEKTRIGIRIGTRIEELKTSANIPSFRLDVRKVPYFAYPAAALPSLSSLPAAHRTAKPIMS